MSSQVSSCRGQLEEIVHTQNYTLGRPFHFRFSLDESKIYFLQADTQNPSACLYAFDWRLEKTTCLLDPSKMISPQTNVTTYEAAQEERKRIKTQGLSGFLVSANFIITRLNGQTWIYDINSQCAVRLVLRGTPSAVSTKISPNGSHLAYVHEHNLYIADLPTKLQGHAGSYGVLSLSPKALTTYGTQQLSCGLAEFVAQEEMGRYDGFWWSPDSSQIVYQECDNSKVEELTIANLGRPQQPANLMTYPRAGQNNVSVRLFVIKLQDNTSQEITWNKNIYPYLARVQWPTHGPLCLLLQTRNQQAITYGYVNETSLEFAPWFEEFDPSWINLSNTTPAWLPDGSSFLWASEESGWWRLERKYLSENKLSILKREIIVPETSNFHSLVHINTHNNTIWFLGGDKPTELHLFMSRLDDAEEPIQVTEEPGQHAAIFSKNGKICAIIHTSIQSPREAVLYNVNERIERQTKIRHVATTPAKLPNVEIVSAADNDGLTAAIVRPDDFKADKKYPVVLYVYGGPGYCLVQNNMHAWSSQQWIANKGFIVVSIDGRGTPRRGRDFERAIYKSFYSVPAQDQIKGLRSLGRKYKELDLDRVGIYGWSFGGYLSALCIMNYPEIFKAAVVGAPVVDWQYYDTHYTERYLGTLVCANSTQTYEKNSLLGYTSNLERPMMLIHGVNDDNVHLTHSVQLAHSLFFENKNFEFVPLLDTTHQIAHPNTRIALQQRIVSFLGQHLW